MNSSAFAEAGLGAQEAEVEAEFEEKAEEKGRDDMQASGGLKSTCTTDYDFAPSSMEALARAVAGLAGCSITGEVCIRNQQCRNHEI